MTAGNASQLSDGAAAVVVMEGKEAERRGLEPLGAFRGFTVAGWSRMKWASGRYLPCRDFWNAMV